MTDNRDQTPEHLQIPPELADDPAAACEFLTARFFALTGDAEAAARAAQMATNARQNSTNTGRSTPSAAEPTSTQSASPHTAGRDTAGTGQATAAGSASAERPGSGPAQPVSSAADDLDAAFSDEVILEAHIHECPLCHDDSPIIQLLRKRLQEACAEKAPESLKMRIITHITAYTYIDYTDSKD